MQVLLYVKVAGLISSGVAVKGAQGTIHYNNCRQPVLFGRKQLPKGQVLSARKFLSVCRKVMEQLPAFPFFSVNLFLHPF